MGIDDLSTIRSIFDRYLLDAAAVSHRRIDTWLGTSGDDEIKEKIIGEDTLRHVNFLELAFQAGNVVVHILAEREEVQKVFGTGFMISDSLLMTNNHVIRTRAEAEKAEYSFYYQLGVNGLALERSIFEMRRDGLFYTNEALDFTVCPANGRHRLPLSAV